MAKLLNFLLFPLKWKKKLTSNLREVFFLFPSPKRSLKKILSKMCAMSATKYCWGHLGFIMSR